MDGGDMAVAIKDLLEGLDVFALGQRGGFALDEEADILRADLDVKLKADNVPLADEGLVRAGVRAGEQGGAWRQLERVAVPVKDG